MCVHQSVDRCHGERGAASRSHWHERGFTLVELGVTLAVIAVLMSMVGASLRGSREIAMRQRLGEEMRNLVDAGFAYYSETVVWKRNATTSTAFGSSIVYDDNGLTQDLVGTGPVIINLSAGGVPTRLKNYILGKGSFDGLNPFGVPYQMEIRPRRVVIRTCAPDDDIVHMIASLHVTPAIAPGCPAAAPVGLALSRARVLGNLDDLAFEKRYLHQE